MNGLVTPAVGDLRPFPLRRAQSKLLRAPSLHRTRFAGSRLVETLPKKKPQPKAGTLSLVTPAEYLDISSSHARSKLLRVFVAIEPYGFNSLCELP